MILKKEKVQEMFERYIKRKRYNQSHSSSSQDGLWSAGECSEAEKWLTLCGIDLSYFRIQNMIDGTRDPIAFDPASKKLWARIGVTIECTDEELKHLKELMNKDSDAAKEFLNKIVNERGYRSGESYLPYSTDDNPNVDDFVF